MTQASQSDSHPKHKHQPTSQAHLAGVRAIAFLEALKGAGVMILGFAFIQLVHKDVGEWAENIVYNLHLDPDHWIAKIFLNKASAMTDSQLHLLALGCAAYTCVRFTEAYGLWYRRAWAEWFAVISSSLYLPYEIYEIARKTTWLRWVVFLSNIAIIVYLLYIRMKSDEERKAAAAKAEEKTPAEVVNHQA